MRIISSTLALLLALSCQHSSIDAFALVHVPATRKAQSALKMNAATPAMQENIHNVKSRSDVVIPSLRRTKPRKIALMIEPTPFTHVSGYSNRFKELLRFLSKAGDNVEIVTTESEAKMKSSKEEFPTSIFGYKIHHTLGFTFPLYDHIALTFDLPDMMGAKVIEKLKPDLIHATSP